MLFFVLVIALLALGGLTFVWADSRGLRLVTTGCGVLLVAGAGLAIVYIDCYNADCGGGDKLAGAFLLVGAIGLLLCFVVSLLLRRRRKRTR